MPTPALATSYAKRDSCLGPWKSQQLDPRPEGPADLLEADAPAGFSFGKSHGAIRWSG